MIRLSIEWEPRDWWIGLYWTTKTTSNRREWHYYLCLLPCLPLHIVWGVRETL
jgi:hypothetical protein